MQKSLMQQGFEALISPKERFAQEEAFGKKVLALAWAVEIFAVLIGISIAIIYGMSGYDKIENPTFSDKTNAITGTLPFFAIAIVELAKIPLAAGLYKVRIFGWRVLILTALVCLTIVTFETMFLGLEQRTTNMKLRLV